MLDVRVLTELLREHYSLSLPKGYSVKWFPTSVYHADLNRSVHKYYQVFDGVNRTQFFDDAREAAACFLNLVDPIRTIWGPVE